jgi:hypothetical protein
VLHCRSPPGCHFYSLRHGYTRYPLLFAVPGFCPSLVSTFSHSTRSRGCYPRGARRSRDLGAVAPDVGAIPVGGVIAALGIAEALDIDIIAFGIWALPIVGRDGHHPYHPGPSRCPLSSMAEPGVLNLDFSFPTGTTLPLKRCNELGFGFGQCSPCAQSIKNIHGLAHKISVVPSSRPVGNR